MTNIAPLQLASDAFGMTDLEEALRGADGAAVRRAAAARLNTLGARIEVELGRGAPPQRYERLTALRRAVGLASSVVASKA